MLESADIIVRCPILWATARCYMPDTLILMSKKNEKVF